MVKKYGYETFSCENNGITISFNCYTTNTRNGFCHHAICSWNDEHTRRSYLNRTWERFRYESVLYDAIGKLPKEMQGFIKANIIDKNYEKAKQEAESFLSAFKQEYKKATPRMKQALSKVNIQTHEQAKSVLAITTAFNLMMGNK